MLLNTSTDYAIRMVRFLAKNAKTVSSSKLSKELGISSRYLIQIAAKLRDAGIVVVSYGPNGGYGLAHPAKDISIFDIITVMEERIQSKQYPPDEVITKSESFDIIDVAYEYTVHVIGEILRSMTIESLISQATDQWYLAPCLLEQNKKK